MHRSKLARKGRINGCINRIVCFVLSCSFIMSITTLTLTPALILWDYLFQMWRAVQDFILSARTHTSVVKITILDGKDVEDENVLLHQGKASRGGANSKLGFLKCSVCNQEEISDPAVRHNCCHGEE